MHTLMQAPDGVSPTYAPRVAAPLHPRRRSPTASLLTRRLALLVAASALAASTGAAQGKNAPGIDIVVKKKGAKSTINISVANQDSIVVTRLERGPEDLELMKVIGQVAYALVNVDSASSPRNRRAIQQMQLASKAVSTKGISTTSD
jgi:hypothetical protein